MISSVVIKVQQKLPKGQMKIVWPLLPNDPFPGECQAEFVVVSHCLNIGFQFITYGTQPQIGDGSLFALLNGKLNCAHKHVRNS